MTTQQTLKGFRDFLPEEARKRQQIIQSIRATFERYGFDCLETPALEYAETLLGKYGSEADKLLYLFEDNGGRKVGMRYDQTVPLARVIAQYPQLPMPFKRYQIQPVWRAENTQKGRYREFLQCDIDTVGSDSPLADAEIIACTVTAAKELGFPTPVMMINDRTVFDTLGFSTKEVIVIDKLDKIGRENVIEELKKLGRENAEEQFTKLEKVEKPERLQKIFQSLATQGFLEDIDFVFNPFIARGLDYYTSTIYELKEKTYTGGSIAGGGRYDKLIGQFSGRELPAVGIAFGFDRMIDALTELNKLGPQKTATQVLVTIFSAEQAQISQEITMKLRAAGITTELYLSDTAKLEKQLKYADNKKVPYVVIIGPDEQNQNEIVVKEMLAKKQETTTLEAFIRKLTDTE